MKVAVLNAVSPFVYGGAEYFADGLVDELRAQGHTASIIGIPMVNLQGPNLLDRMLAFRMLEIDQRPHHKVDLTVALKFPAFLIPHSDKILWVLHQYRAAYDLWDRKLDNLHADPLGEQYRRAIMQADNLALNEAKAVYTISENISGRLKKYNNFAAPAIYTPPANAESFFCAPAEDYILCVSRMNPLKRQALLVEALAHTREPVKLVLAGNDLHDHYERHLLHRIKVLNLEDRVRWVVDFPEQEKYDLYAKALAVAFTPIDEDYGYVTLEAMLAGKAVLTTKDAGGVLEFITDDENGYVVDSAPQSVAMGLDKLWQDRSKTKQMGENGQEKYHAGDISWRSAVRKLLA